MNQPDARTHHVTELRYDVAATPEEVWEAIATADGISAWMVPATLDPRVGGEVSFDLGGMTSTGVVTAYDPPTHLAFEEPWPIATEPEDVDPGMARWFASLGISLAEVHAGLAEVSPIATEMLVEAVSGGSCVVRVVTSAYGAGADWEHEFFSEMVASLTPMYDRLVAHLAAMTTGGAR